MHLYGPDLARVQAEAFGEIAERASPALVALLRASTVTVRRVYDLGCGAGVTTAALVAAGFDTTGVDRSPDLLAFARQRAPRATFVNASLYEIALAPCEAVLAIGEVLTYHPLDVDADARVRAFLEAAARAIVPGGRLVFDLIDADGPSLDAKSFRHEPSWTLLWETREDRDAARLTRTVDTFVRESDGRYRHVRETHAVKLFRERQTCEWLAGAGFDVVTSRAYSDAPLAPRRVAYVATRR